MDDGDTAALIALQIGLLSKLSAKGLLSREEVKDIFDLSTLQLEVNGLVNTPVGKRAHDLLSLLQTIFEAPPPKSHGRD